METPRNSEIILNDFIKHLATKPDFQSGDIVEEAEPFVGSIVPKFLPVHQRFHIVLCSKHNGEFNETYLKQSCNTKVCILQVEKFGVGYSLCLKIVYAAQLKKAEGPVDQFINEIIPIVKQFQTNTSFRNIEMLDFVSVCSDVFQNIDVFKGVDLTALQVLHTSVIPEKVNEWNCLFKISNPFGKMFELNEMFLVSGVQEDSSMKIFLIPKLFCVSKKCSK